VGPAGVSLRDVTGKSCRSHSRIGCATNHLTIRQNNSGASEPIFIKFCLLIPRATARKYEFPADSNPLSMITNALLSSAGANLVIRVSQAV